MECVPKYLTFRQATEMYPHLTIKLLREWRKAGKMPFYRFGKKLLVRPMDIEEKIVPDTGPVKRMPRNVAC